jgi:ABC-2 type transport system ATP-binding protein
MRRAAGRTIPPLLALLIGGGVSLGLASPAAAAENVRIPGGPLSAGDPTPVSLDAAVYLPARTPAPAVVLAHGFGGSKESVVADARIQLQAAKK